MSDKVAVVFTAKPVERILREQGTSSWRLDRNHANRCAFAVCTRNSKPTDWIQEHGPEPHGSAFLVGKVRDVVPSPYHEGRYLIRFSEYARIDVPDAWKGDRNPIRYLAIEDLGIDFSTLEWRPMPEPEDSQEPTYEEIAPPTGVGPLTMAQAKQGLSLGLGVPLDAIEITVRG